MEQHEGWMRYPAGHLPWRGMEERSVRETHFAMLYILLDFNYLLAGKFKNKTWVLSHSSISPQWGGQSPARTACQLGAQLPA